MPTALNPRHWRAVILSVAAAACGYLAFSLWGGWHEVLASVGRVGWGGVALLLALSALNYGLRFLRWQLYLRTLGHPQPWRPSLLIYIGGFALTTTPGKAGEALRSLFLKTRGMPFGPSMAAFLSERLSDLLAIVLLCLLGVGLSARHPGLQALVLVAVALLALSFLLIAQGRLLQRWQARAQQGRSRLARGLAQALSLLASARTCHRPSVLLVATALSLVAWSAEAWAFHRLLGMLGGSPALAFSFSVYAIGMLAGALSFLPGGLGGTEATMVGLLLMSGLSQPVAVVATVLIRLTTLWFAVALGLAALLRLLRRAPVEPAEPAAPARA